MKKKLLVSITTISLIAMVFSSPSFAEDNVESLNQASSENIIEEEPTPEPTPEPTYAPGMSPGEHAGWIAVDQNGNAVSEGMVCTPEVCGETGEGSWLELAIEGGILPPNSRLVLQTLQDPVEAANSSNGVGNVTTYPNAQYDSQNNSWTFIGEGGATYRVPLAYPGEDLGGNLNYPECVENCPPPPCEEDPNYLEREECLDNPNGELTGDGPLSVSDNSSIDDSSIVERSKYFVVNQNIQSDKRIRIVFKEKVKNIKIIAKRWQGKEVTKKSWLIKNSRKKRVHVFSVPQKYDGWKIIVKDKKNIRSISLL